MSQEEKKYYLTQEQKEFLSRPFPRFERKSVETLAQEARAVFKNLQPGQMIEGEGIFLEGIFLGCYKPDDRDGNSLGKTFNVLAAPQDLPDMMTYIETVKYVAELKNWYGFDGANYTTDKDIYAALKDGSYNGGWIVPSRVLLAGTEHDGKSGICKGKVIQLDNLLDHHNKGAFKGTFKTAATRASGYPDWYWSSTEYRGYSSFVHIVRFSDGYESWSHKDDGRLSCRPVRLVAAPSLG